LTGSRRGWSADAVLIVAMVMVHFTLYQFFVRWPAMPNFLIGGLLLAALRMRAGYAAFLGFGLGVLDSAMGLEGLGTISLVLVLVGYLGARSRDLLFADARPYVFIYLFAGTWIAEVVLALAMPGGPSLLNVLVLAPVSALCTAVVCGAAESVAANIRRL
jgi:cell shape-determining protein MreD